MKITFIKNTDNPLLTEINKRALTLSRFKVSIILFKGLKQKS